MPERLLEGIQITETPGAEQPIARASAHLTAFVGRTLRGPIDRPVPIQSFADFQQEFGGLWQPSPLSYAVEHFFEQGRSNFQLVGQRLKICIELFFPRNQTKQTSPLNRPDGRRAKRGDSSRSITGLL